LRVDLGTQRSSLGSVERVALQQQTSFIQPAVLGTARQIPDGRSHSFQDVHNPAHLDAGRSYYTEFSKKRAHWSLVIGRVSSVRVSHTVSVSTLHVHTAAYRSVTLFINSVTDRSCINRIACNSHSDNKKPIPGTHVDNKMCDCRPLHSVISGSICVRAGERFFVGLTQPARKPTYFQKFHGSCFVQPFSYKSRFKSSGTSGT
jgi:hypothetical protein